MTTILLLPSIFYCAKYLTAANLFWILHKLIFHLPQINLSSHLHLLLPNSLSWIMGSYTLTFFSNQYTNTQYSLIYINVSRTKASKPLTFNNKNLWQIQKHEDCLSPRLIRKLASYCHKTRRNKRKSCPETAL